jgi:hypothetical protein
LDWLLVKKYNIEPGKNSCCLNSNADDDEFCYKFVANSVNWHMARAACESEEGRLVSIHTAAENAFIAVKFK